MRLVEVESSALCRFGVRKLEAKTKTINIPSAERLLSKIQFPVTDSIRDFHILLKDRPVLVAVH